MHCMVFAHVPMVTSRSHLHSAECVLQFRGVHGPKDVVNMASFAKTLKGHLRKVTEVLFICKPCQNKFLF